MITDLKLVNFRNFENLKLENLEKQNFIIGENGKWKTNILESISLLCNNSITWLGLDELVKKWEDYFFIEYKNNIWEKFSFSYSKEKKKKQYMINNNKVSSKKFNDTTNKCVVFSPIIMNMLYLSPSLRRDFLDKLLSSSYTEYKSLLSSYKKVIINRNKTLKAISEWKCEKSEIKFWDKKLIELSNEIYYYRFKFINFIKKSINNTKEYFWWKIENVEFIYETKVKEKNIKEDTKDYLDKNLNRDILIWRTAIWPHIDDFKIIVDWINIIEYASRGETKSIIIWLKLIEWIFIEKVSYKKPLLIIDDLLSELDEIHKNLLMKKIEYYQTFISSIEINTDKKIIKI